LIPNIAFVETRLGVHCGPVSRDQVVDNGNVITLLYQTIDGVRTDVTGTT
jgi:hypothetical protein